MGASTTMTIRVSEEVSERLTRLSRDTRRSRSFLAAEALASYLDRELAIIAGVQRGLADIEAGRTVPNAQAIEELNAIARADTSE